MNRDHLNLNESVENYSILFDKNEHNFSTSSEISLIPPRMKTSDPDPDDDLQFTLDDNATMIDESDHEETFLSANSSFDNDPIQENLAKVHDPRRSRTPLIEKYFDDEINAENTALNYDHQNDEIEKKNQPVESVQRKSSNNPKNDDEEEEDRAFHQFLQEHRTTNINEEEKENASSSSSVKERPRGKKQRNSLKEFICDSSSEDENAIPAEFYRKVDQMIDQRSTWRKVQPIDPESDESSEVSSESSSSTSDEDYSPRPEKKKVETFNFLESLSNHIPLVEKHPDAKEYFLRSGFKTKAKREKLAKELFFIFDRDVFSSKLAEKVTLVWSGRLTATAGHCTTRRTTLTALITLSNKVCDSPERCRDTLLHEMCHAAVSLIDGALEHGHGTLWKQWKRKAEQRYPYLPLISVTHSYDIKYKFIYRCVQCQYEVYRHSKSLNIDTDRCGKCLSRFELFLNEKTEGNVGSGTPAGTPKRTPNRYNLFVKEHFHRMKQEQPHLSTPQLMKQLSQQYQKKLHQENPIELPDLDQLKI